jgi:PAS domain S-box-containing protein
MNAEEPVSKFPRWRQWLGPIITLAIAAAVELLLDTVLSVPNPPGFLVLAIVFAAFHGGLASGLISAAIAWTYIAIFFSSPGHVFQYTDENLHRVIIWALSMPAMALMVGRLKDRAAQDTARHEREVSFRALFEAAPDALVVADHEGRITQVNAQAEKMFGYGGEGLRGQTLEILLPERFRESHERRRAEFFANPRIRPMGMGLELMALRQDSSEFLTEIGLSPIRLEGGRPGVVAAIRDVSGRRKMEEALRESEARYRILFEQAAEGIFVANRAGRYTDVNSSGCALLGYARDELLQMSMEDVILPEDLAAEPLRLNELLAGNTVVSERRLKRKDGAPVLVEINARMLPDGQLLGMVRDITRRKQMEERLAESEARLRTIIQSEPECVKVVARDGALLDMNPAGLEMIEADSLEQVAGAPVLHLVAPEYREQFQALNACVFAGEAGSLEFEIVGLRGTRRWLETRAVPLRNAQGEIVSMLSLTRDITERKQAEAALRESETRFRALIENSADVIVLADADGMVRYASPSVTRIMGYAYDEYVGRNGFELIHPDDLPEAQSRFTQILQQPGVNIPVTLRQRHKDGSWRWLDVVANNLLAKPEVGAIVVNFRDITGRKQAEDILQQSEARLSEAQRVAHVGSWELDLLEDKLAWSDEIYRIFEIDPARFGASYQAFLEAVHPEDRVFVDDAYTSSVRNRVPYQIDHRLLMRDGRVKHVHERCETLYDPEGKPIRSTGTVQDITERKQAEQAEREQRVLAEALRDTAAALNTTLDFDEILDRILANAGRVVPHDTSSIMLIDGGVARIARHRGFAERGLAEQALALRFPVKSTPKFRQVNETGKTIVVQDTLRDPLWLPVPGFEWIRAHVSAPIHFRGVTLGFINLDSATPETFTSRDAEHLQAFADQASAALHNAQLFAETRRHLTKLEAVAKVSTALRAAQSLDDMLPLLLDETLAVLNAEVGAIWLYDPVHDNLRSAIAHGWFISIDEMPLKPGEGIAGHVFASGQTHRSREFVSDPRTRESVRPKIPAGWGGVCVPIRTAQTVVGVLFISVQSPRELTDEEVRLLTTLAEIAGNALHRTRLYELTERRLEQMQALRLIDQAITSTLDLRLTLGVILEQATARLGVDAADVLLLSPRAPVLECAATRGFRAAAPHSIRLRVGEGDAGRVVLERQLVHIPDLRSRRTDIQRSPLFAAEAFVCSWCMPLIAKGQVKGVLELFHRAPLTPDQEWMDFLEALAGQAAIAINNAELFEGLQHANLELVLAYDATIEGWSRALDLRDKETEGHTQRVTELTLQLARAMGAFGEAALVHIRRGALLHDIGKMGIPDGILLKAGPLTAEEWAIMRKHPQYAYDMLSPISYLRPALDIPYCHHEKWDGTGYPHGLKGEQIPLAARVFAMVDVWDALRSDRPYRQSWPEAQVLEYIKAQAGKHFDPKVVEAFLRL